MCPLCYLFLLYINVASYLTTFIPTTKYTNYTFYYTNLHVIWLNNCSGRVQFSVARISHIVAFRTNIIRPAKRESEKFKFYSCDDKNLKKLSMPERFPRRNCFGTFLCEQPKQKSARSLNINTYFSFTTYFTNLIFIFVYIKHHKILLH